MLLCLVCTADLTSFFGRIWKIAFGLDMDEGSGFPNLSATPSLQLHLSIASFLRLVVQPN